MDLLAQTRGISILRVVSDLGYVLHENRKIVCPFHTEKTPSLVVYPQTNSYHCFGCGRHGDVIHFYAGVSRLEYTAAMHQLAFNYLPDYKPELYKRGKLEKIQKTGLSRPEKVTLPADTKTYEYKPLHSDIYEDFRRICELQPSNAVRDEAWQYLTGRGFSEATLRKFRIFTVNDYHAAQAYLRNTYALLDLQEAGLFNEKGNLIFYRHSILIPYYRRGRILFLQGRVIGNPTDTVSRYQFLSGVPVELFNADVMDILKTGQTLYLTEGAFDCMTLMQEGMPAVSLGSATMFKREWMKQFRRFEICFYFDNDAAGQKAAREYGEVFGQYGVSTRVKTVKEGYKDVNDYFSKRE
ncbi:CHC2 zinc finger domain-containing protein [Larkinella sp. VNQ87]|uniref:CHC2 zinc finger domain-containing protein n=1 Tax=Larkinella sp. VNQ87 TaxID=3400921 RepID=UPI003C0A1306